MAKYKLVKANLSYPYEKGKEQIVEFMWETAHGWRGRVLEKDAPNETARERQFWSNRAYSFVKEEPPKTKECEHDKAMTVYRGGKLKEMCMDCGQTYESGEWKGKKW